MAQNAAMNLRASACKTIACCLLALLGASVGAADKIGPGDVPPPLIGWTAGGDLVRVPNYAGKAVILTFWASWCGYCLKELPVLDNVQRVAGADNIAVFAINTEDRKVFRQIEPVLHDKLQLTLVRDADGAGQRNYGVTGLPHMVIIGRDGRVRRIWHGYAPEELDAIVADINAALAAPRATAP